MEARAAKKNQIFLCAQCVTQVVWPKSMYIAQDQPYEKRKCELCKRLCYGTLYDLKGE